jgi:hypothetical protein
MKPEKRHEELGVAITSHPAENLLPITTSIDFPTALCSREWVILQIEG